MGKKTSFDKLYIYTSSKKLVTACYALTQTLPAEETTNLAYFIRNAALKAHLAVVDGIFSEKGKPKKKLLKQATAHFLTIDAVIDVLVDVELVKEEQTKEVVELASACYQQLKMLKKK